MSSRSFYFRFGKRILDLIFAVAALIVLSPLYAIVALIVRLGLGSPVLFRQQRPGWNQVPFELFKFRTMADAYDRSGEPLPDEMRVTRLGRWLRRSSLDELPQLWNVLRGELSLVGPRPLLMEYLPLYDEVQMRRHEVRPGLTGWAQVNGRNALTWEEKFEYDVWYVENLSFALDLRILLATARKVVARDAVEGPGNEKFRGTQQ